MCYMCIFITNSNICINYANSNIPIPKSLSHPILWAKVIFVQALQNFECFDVFICFINAYEKARF